MPYDPTNSRGPEYTVFDNLISTRELRRVGNKVLKNSNKTPSGLLVGETYPLRVSFDQSQITDIWSNVSDPKKTDAFTKHRGSTTSLNHILNAMLGSLPHDKLSDHVSYRFSRYPLSLRENDSAIDWHRDYQEPHYTLALAYFKGRKKWEGGDIEIARTSSDGRTIDYSRRTSKVEMVSGRGVLFDDSKSFHRVTPVEPYRKHYWGVNLDFLIVWWQQKQK